MGDAFTFRRATKDEMAAAGKQIDYAFNEEGGEGFGVRPEWSLCAFDGERLAATSAAYPFQMGFDGKDLACAGVTIVTTEPEYRRRGLVRELMTQTLHQAHDEGKPVAALWASMSAIYQRFGYGLASNFNSYRIDPRDVVFREDSPVTGYVRRLDAETALPLIKDIYARSIRGKTLTVEREDFFWDVMYLAREKDKRHFAVYYDKDDKPRGFAVYRQKSFTRTDAGPDIKLSISDFIWLDMECYHGLWNYFCSYDLAGRLEFWFMPDDDPAPHLLLEPRRLNRRASDAIWLRVVDVPALLGERGYSLGGTATLTISNDDLCPWNNGTWTVSADGNGARARVEEGGATESALNLTINTLATLSSGHTTASQLARIGKIECDDTEALRKADALFSTVHRPWCPHEF